MSELLVSMCSLPRVIRLILVALCCLQGQVHELDSVVGESGLFFESSLHTEFLLPQRELSSCEETVDLEICIQHEEICVCA